VNHSRSVVNLLFFFAILAFSACNSNAPEQKPAAAPSNSLFTLLSPEKTHVNFSNNLTEGLNTNVLIYEYFYNGGGVALGDVNGDGLPDMYFTGNMTDNKH
jgi:hypothetical protein